MGTSTSPVWQRPVADFPSLLHLAPPIARAHDSLEAVVSVLAFNPSARSVFVVDDEDHLLGIISERRLDRDLVKVVLPRSLWPSVSDLSPRELLVLAKGKAQTAGDLMRRCASASTETPLKDALAEMIRDDEPVLPLVDDQRRLLGYLSLFEILAELLHQSGT
jgi:CBS domain-containing protein